VEVQVYRVEETDELYEKLDALYVQQLDNTSGSDFWDMWSAVLTVLEPHKIVDEVLNP